MANRITRNFFDQWRWLLMVLILLLAACTNSEWFLSVLYNRADNMMADEVFEYADYSDEQEQQIEAIIDHFHLWHRVTQLPEYADFLKSISSRMRSGEPVTHTEILSWYNQIEAFADVSSRCHPILYGMDIMRSLSDEQVKQISDHMQHQYDRYMERSEKRTAEERLDRWHRNRVRWLNRFDLDPDSAEKEALRAMLQEMPNMREANFELWQAWDRGLLELLEDRDAPDFEDRMRAHIHSLATLTVENYPDRVTKAQSLWINYLVELLNARIRDQDNDFADWADNMAENLRAISVKIPENQENLDPVEYCVAATIK